jgi:CheY-like chemotaxis protein
MNLLPFAAHEDSPNRRVWRGAGRVRGNLLPVKSGPNGPIMSLRPSARITERTTVASTNAVLFVDDEASILNSVKRLLRKEPYTVLTAGGGAEGLRVLAEHQVQVVVTDQRMPAMSGIEFLQEVKLRWPDTVRLVLSGYADADTIVAAINKGEVYRFMPKPWQDDALRHTLAQAFDHWHMVQENRRLNELTIRQVGELRRLNSLLEGSVEARTRSLQFAQEMLEQLPQVLLGISADGEVMLTSQLAAECMPGLHDLVPGTDMDEVLPADAACAVRRCLEDRDTSPFAFEWDGRLLRARPALLGQADELRGCVLLLDGTGGDDDGDRPCP